MKYKIENYEYFDERDGMQDMIEIVQSPASASILLVNTKKSFMID